jgi:predicted aldo/keto reductase-like oxidoreductase
VSALSIGAMRLPSDMEQAVALLRQAIDAGCNYIDTSRGYGDSELKLAKALKNGYRSKVLLSTKCSPWIFKEEGYTNSADDARRKIKDSMKRLEVDRLDFYQVWNVDCAENYAQAIAKGGVVDGIHQAMKGGLVDHIAATTHAPEGVVFEMIDSGLFEAITVTYHLMDRKREAVLERALAKGVGIVVMNPMGGGFLGQSNAVIRGLLPGTSLESRELALRFVLDHPAVSCAISGFSKPSDVQENVATAKGAPLTEADRTTLAEHMAALDQRTREFCTACGYCLPCEQGVEIRRILRIAAMARVFDMTDVAKWRYRNLVKPEGRADKCTRCGQCEPKCTNKLDIREELAKAHQLLA